MEEIWKVKELAKFELTFKQYLDSIMCELSIRLSSKCYISVIRNKFGYGGLKTIMKEYPEFDSLKIDWGDWHYLLDTKDIERAYKKEKSINEFVEILIDYIKVEFAKQIMREDMN